MDSVVRQRLVGTLVLVALGVVFWPIIFVEPRDQQPIELSPMPARPEIDTSPIASPESPEAKVRAQVAEPEFDELEQARADELTRLPEDLGEVGLADLQAADAIEQVSSREQPPAAPVPLLVVEALATRAVAFVEERLHLPATLDEAQEATEEIDEALVATAMEQAVRLDPDSVRSRVNLARIRNEMTDFEGALEASRALAYQAARLLLDDITGEGLSSAERTRRIQEHWKEHGHIHGFVRQRGIDDPAGPVGRLRPGADHDHGGPVRGHPSRGGSPLAPEPGR